MFHLNCKSITKCFAEFVLHSKSDQRTYFSLSIATEENVVNHFYTTLLHDPITQNHFSPVSVRLITPSAWRQNCCVVGCCSGCTMVHTAGVWVLRLCPCWCITQNQLSSGSVRSITHSACGQNCCVVVCCSGCTMVHTAGVWVLRLFPGWHMLGWEEIHCKEEKRELYPV